MVPLLFAFYIQGVLKFKCKIPVPKAQSQLQFKLSVTEHGDVVNAELFKTTEGRRLGAFEQVSAFSYIFGWLDVECGQAILKYKFKILNKIIQK